VLIDLTRPTLCVIDPDYGEVRTPVGHAYPRNGTRGLVGGKRDDGLENLDWLCARATGMSTYRQR
jgi:hypothetical protein